MVMATPFLHALRNSDYGELWAIGKASAIHIYNGLNLFDRFISIDDKGIVASLERSRELKKVGFNRAVALPHSFRSAFFFYNLRIGEIIGYSRNSRGFMIHHKIREKGESPESTVEHYLRIADAMGAHRTIQSPLLMVTEDEEIRFRENFDNITAPYGVLIFGAEYGPSKCWPPKHFSRLADMIFETYGIKTYLLPGKEEKALAQSIIDGLANKEAAVIRDMNVRDLKVCLSRAAFVVSNDTGPRHISAALSVPTIVLLGPMDDRYTDYLSFCTYKISRTMPCRPCNKKQCSKGHECLTTILPDEVFGIVRGIIEKKE